MSIRRTGVIIIRAWREPGSLRTHVSWKLDVDCGPHGEMGVDGTQQTAMLVEYLLGRFQAGEVTER